tara:strand:+ start:489 stop:659 length:171 start_codon:yes stop_codon:yes gene_type:complete
MAKDGAHYPSKQFKENFDSIFKRKKKNINLSPSTKMRNNMTRKFLEEISNEDNRRT